MKTWLKRFGVAGFAFFFIKGMLWLTIPAAIVVFRGCGAAGEPAEEAAAQATSAAVCPMSTLAAKPEEQ